MMGCCDGPILSHFIRKPCLQVHGVVRSLVNRIAWSMAWSASSRWWCLGAVLLWWLFIWRTTTHSVTRSFNRHFHRFLSQWQAVDKNAATCVSCHAGHAADGDPTLSFLNEQRATDVCQACHRVAGS